MSVDQVVLLLLSALLVGGLLWVSFRKTSSGPTDLRRSEDGLDDGLADYPSMAIYPGSSRTPPFSSFTRDRSK